MTKTLREASLRSEASETLDPQDWNEIRALGHRMLDDMIDHVASIRERLFSLPDETVVYPGHGLDTTIGRERPTSRSGSPAAGKRVISDW